MEVNEFSKENVTDMITALDNLFLEEEVDILEVAASFGTLSTFGTATGCASTASTVGTWSP